MTLRFLAEGMDFRVYTAGHLVLRFPKREECAGWLATEIAILAALAPTLPAPVPRHRPAIAAVGAYELIPGTPGDLIDPATCPALAPALGRFLAALHAFPVARAEALGIRPKNGWLPQPYLEFVRGQALGALLPARCAAFLAADAPGLPAAEACVIHGDLEAEHVLVADGTLAGVIDWSDVSIASPARDLAALWAWGGDGFLDGILAAYARPIDRALIHYLGRCFAISDWVEADPEDRGFAQRQLERAFS